MVTWITIYIHTIEATPIEIGKKEYGLDFHYISNEVDSNPIEFIDAAHMSPERSALCWNAIEIFQRITKHT